MLKNTLILTISLLVAATLSAQNLPSDIYSGLKLRNLSPGKTSGRIADIAIDQKDKSTYLSSIK